MSKKCVVVDEVIKECPKFFYPETVIDKVATGKNLKRLRENAKLSVDQLADFFFGSVSCSAIYAWESGKSLPHLTHLLTLCCLYDNYHIDKLIVWA